MFSGPNKKFGIQADWNRMFGDQKTYNGECRPGPRICPAQEKAAGNLAVTTDRAPVAPVSQSHAPGTGTMHSSPMPSTKSASIIDRLTEEGAPVSNILEDMLFAIGSLLSMINQLRVELTTTQKHVQDQQCLLQDESWQLQLKHEAPETSTSDSPVTKQANVTPLPRKDPKPLQVVKPLCKRESNSVHQSATPSVKWDSTPPPHEVVVDMPQDVDPPDSDSDVSDEGSCSPEPSKLHKGKEIVPGDPHYNQPGHISALFSVKVGQWGKKE
ncbi:hypothetical protein BDQ17DRAFT_1429738 [Cyathus striatus]|nr:hypothetical protein BDQ17DRAFT_1429738 [Cyathus striatus]